MKDERHDDWARQFKVSWRHFNGVQYIKISPLYYLDVLQYNRLGSWIVVGAMARGGGGGARGENR